MAGISTLGWKIIVYDFLTRKQSELSTVLSGFPAWSPDGHYLFFQTWRDDASLWRVRIYDLKADRITTLKDKRLTAGWFAPAPNNSLITSRSTGTDEIYALDWEAP
jgi:hypothetical protein